MIRLIAGGLLGTAFSVSLMLPGTVVLPDPAPSRHLGLPDRPTATIVHAAPLPAPRQSAASKPGHAPRSAVVRSDASPRAGAVPAPRGRSLPRLRSGSQRATDAPATALTPLAAPARTESGATREDTGKRKPKDKERSKGTSKSKAKPKQKLKSKPKSESKGKPKDRRRDDRGDEDEDEDGEDGGKATGKGRGGDDEGRGDDSVEG